MTMVPKVIVKFISPIVMTLGAYVVLHGHLSPGGGFQGGVILRWCGSIGVPRLWS